MSERTQYGVLVIVALVAIVSIFTMTNMAATPSQATQSPTASITGQAIVSYPAYSQMDYDYDGRVSQSDLELLEEYVDRQMCPSGKTCDIDRNTLLDARDVQQLEGLFIEPFARKSTTTQPTRQRTVYVPSTTEDTVPYLLA